MSTEVATKPLNMAEVKQGIQKYEQALEQMKADYLPLLNTPITDKKQLEVVKAARMNFKNTRLEGVSRLDAGCKALHANWKLWVKARDTYEKKFSDEEEKFREAEKVFEDAEARKFLEIAQAEQRRLASLKERMYEVGFKYDGIKYVLEGFAEITEAEIAGLSVDYVQIGEWLNNLERQVAEHKEREEELARTAKVAADALAKQQQEEADRLAMVAQEQARREKELADKEAAMNARILNTRLTDLKAVRATTTKPNVEVLAMSDTEWTAYLIEAKRVAEIFEEERKKADERAAKARKEEEERIAKEAVEKAERDRIAAELKAKEDEQERLAKMSDSAKFTAYREALLAVPVPELKSKAGRARMSAVVVELKNLLKA
jgi:hypothetical protein